MHWFQNKISKVFLFMGCISFICFGFTNKKLDNSLTSNELNNTYLASYSVESFFKTDLADAKIEHDDVDLELLNATLFFTLNKKRTKGRKKALQQNQELFNTCKSIVDKYSGSSLKRYRNKKNRIRKIAVKHGLQNDFHGAYSDIYVDYLPLLNIRDQQKYIFNDDQEEDIFFFSKKRKYKTPHKPVPAHTYQSLVNTMLKRSGKMNGMSQIRNKVFSQLGCYISITQRTPKKMPYVEIVWMVGGYRLDLLNIE